MIKKVFGTNLRHLRLDRKMTQETLAHHAGIEVRFLKDIEAGKKQPTITTLYKLSYAFDLTPDDLTRNSFEQWRSQQE